MQRYFKCLYAHGISLSSSRPPWSPIPPAARRTPEPASRSLPSPFDQVSPGDVEMNSYWRKTSWVKTSLHIPLLPDRTWMFLELTWWKCFCWWVKPGENPRGQNVKIPFYLHQEKLDCNVITQLDKVVQNNCNLCFVHLHLHQWMWQKTMETRRGGKKNSVCREGAFLTRIYLLLTIFWFIILEWH